MIRYESLSPRSARLRAVRDMLTYPLRKLLVPPEAVPYPEILKRRLLRSYLMRYSLHVFIETGTYLGDTVAFMLPYCEMVYSIEIQERLHAPAKARFSGNPKVSVLLGDSRIVLRNLVPGLNQSALFWLDGHFKSGTTATDEIACPVLDELSIILGSPIAHVVLIDDAREFDGKEYPSIATIADVASGRGYRCEVADDVIRMVRGAH